jgi:hypothetical protein
VGLVGVNLLYGAFTRHQDPAGLIRVLMEGVDRRRVEVDMIKFSGPAFQDVDNRLMSLQLVESGLTDTAMFTAGGEVVQASEVLHSRPVLIERGSFRPVTNVTLSMLEASLAQLQQDFPDAASDPVVVMEMTLKNLMSGETIDHRDFIARADILGALDKTVMISSYTTFDQVTTTLRHYTQNWIAMVVGIPTLRAIFDEQYYQELEGGILEGLGRLFRGPVKLLAYPTVSAETGELETAAELDISRKLSHLYAHLFDNGFIEPIRDFDPEQLHVTPGDVLQKIQSGDATWENFVPGAAVALIRRNGLFGFANETGKQRRKTAKAKS